MCHTVCYGSGMLVDHRVEHRAGQCNPGNTIVWVGRCKVEGLVAPNIQHTTNYLIVRCTAQVSGGQEMKVHRLA